MEIMPRITASVVLYNTSVSQVKRLLDCIERSTVRPVVYLIDNSPEPLNHSLLHLPWVIYLRMGKNGGYGAGHNVALRQALDHAEFHFVLNPDIYFEHHELEKMIHFMKDNPGIGQLMPKVLYPDGALQYLCKLLPTPVDLLLRRFAGGPFRHFVRRRLECFELRSTGYNQVMDVPFLSGCFMLFRTSALCTVGLFDERFFVYAEDIDITRRMHTEFRTVFYPGATVVHDHARQSYKSKRALWVHITNLVRYFNKWGWIFDPQRSKVNRDTLKRLRELPATLPTSIASKGEAKERGVPAPIEIFSDNLSVELGVADDKLLASTKGEAD